MSITQRPRKMQKDLDKKMKHENDDEENHEEEEEEEEEEDELCDTSFSLGHLKPKNKFVCSYDIDDMLFGNS